MVKSYRVSYEEMQKNHTLEGFDTFYEQKPQQTPGNSPEQPIHSHLKTSQSSTEAKAGGQNMTTLKQEAEAFVPQLTKNIADLDVVSVELDLEDREGTNKETKEVFKYKVVVIEGEDYRVPGKVIGDLKSILEKKPTLKTFSVSKKGTGLNTLYTVIPMD